MKDKHAAIDGGSTITFSYVRCYTRREEAYGAGLMIFLVLPDTDIQDSLSSKEPIHCVVV